jgi:hypothetical protein
MLKSLAISTDFLEFVVVGKDSLRLLILVLSRPSVGQSLSIFIGLFATEIGRCALISPERRTGLCRKWHLPSF